jgi:hypothetical protein
VNRFIAIGGVWLGCTIAWMLLGSTLVARSGEASTELSREVHQLWGPRIEQRQPRAEFWTTRTNRVTQTVTDATGRTSVQTREEQLSIAVPVPLVSSHLRARLALEQRRRGLLWFATYRVGFHGRYVFSNPDDEERTVGFIFPLTNDAVFDGLRVEDENGRPIATEIGRSAASWHARIAPHSRAGFTVSYRTRGTQSWRYRMGWQTTRATDFHLAVSTNFENVDFPIGTVSPTAHRAHGGRWDGEWSFASLIANQPIGIVLPTPINPGPLATRITFFAPIGMLFFFFVIGVLAAAQRREIHPVHFFFLGCSFFAFHLLFSYLVDHVSIWIAFALSTATSLFLVVSYARLFVGWRFALREMMVSQLLYLVLFSLTFLFEGFTGLAITVGAVITLFVMMQITARARRPTPVPEATPAPAAGPSTVPRTF